MDEHDTVPGLKYLNTLLVDKFRVKRRPVAITLCREGPPPGYETANIVACSVVRAAEGGRKVYIDAANHDCWVGQFHLGWLPEADSYITDGHYLTEAQRFYTPQAAAGNSVFAIGDGGGRMHNRLEAGEMFVSIPRRHFRYIVELIENFSIDPKKMREVIMPSHAAKAAARAAEVADLDQTMHISRHRAGL